MLCLMSSTLTGHLKSFMQDSKTGWFMNKQHFKITLNIISDNSINSSPQILLHIWLSFTNSIIANLYVVMKVTPQYR